MKKSIHFQPWDNDQIPRVHANISKSVAHRLLIAAALSGDMEKVCLTADNAEATVLSQDIKATRACLQAMHMWQEQKEGSCEMQCGESGATFRFLLPLVGALGIPADFFPKGRLPQRPLSPLYEEMEAHGCRLSPQGSVPFCVRGQLTGGQYRIAGNISSQYITGLLFALPLLEQDSELEIIGTLESEDYVKMTLQALKLAGIRIETTEQGFFIPGKQKYCLPDGVAVEGDWSNGAAWLVLGALQPKGSGICCVGLSGDSTQGDRRVVDILRQFGAEVTVTDDTVTVRNVGPLKGITIDAGNVPDLIPVLSVAAAAAEGTTRVIHAERLVLKESDRLQAITEVVNALGGSVENTGNGLVIRGGKKEQSEVARGTEREISAILKGGKVSSVNDHRIVMMAAIASAICQYPVEIEGAEAIRKSYPDFFEICVGLGAAVTEQ